MRRPSARFPFRARRRRNSCRLPEAPPGDQEDQSPRPFEDACSLLRPFELMSSMSPEKTTPAHNPIAMSLKTSGPRTP